MYFKHVPVLALSAALATVAICSAAVRLQSSETADTTSHNIQVTMKPGDTFMIPIPATRYAGAPLEIAIADPTVAPAVVGGNCWMMHQLVSFANGAVSWVAQTAAGVRSSEARGRVKRVLSTFCASSRRAAEANCRPFRLAQAKAYNSQFQRLPTSSRRRS
jgi:hypothetical protein